ncbi:MAG: hypothetical protein R3Y06_09590 [Faecalibacterium sp.]
MRTASYANDYAELSQLKALADELGIAILMIHHFRKQKDGDTFQQISGTTGLQGAVDTMFTLSKLTRDSDRATLKCVGRDIEARELSLVRDQDNIWQKREDSLPNRTMEQTRFVQAVQSFMADKSYYSGTPTELSALLSEQSVDNFSNRIISKNFTLLTSNLENVGIMWSSYRSNGQRMIEIIYESVDSAVKTAV